jgi:hypothetical protein
LHRSDYWILYAGAAVAAIGIGLMVYRLMVKNLFLKKVSRQIGNIFITIGLMEVIWFGLRYENTNALGTKFTAILIALAGLVWMYWPVKYLVTRYKTDMEAAERQVMRDKYLNYNKR